MTFFYTLLVSYLNYLNLEVIKSIMTSSFFMAFYWTNETKKPETFPRNNFSVYKPKPAKWNAQWSSLKILGYLEESLPGRYIYGNSTSNVAPFCHLNALVTLWNKCVCFESSFQEGLLAKQIPTLLLYEKSFQQNNFKCQFNNWKIVKQMFINRKMFVFSFICSIECHKKRYYTFYHFHVKVI